MADVINWYPGHMAKAKREIEGQLRLVDIVLELRDARIPFSSSNPMINEICGNKKRLILLCKSSLADKEITSKWIKYYNDNGISCLDIDSITGRNINLIVKKCYECLKETFKKRKAKGIVSKEIKAMVLGIPNVGKSTLINKLSKRKATKTGDKPGVTKNNTWIKVTEDLYLLDTPGILWPRFDNEAVGKNLSLCFGIRDEIVNLEDIAHFAIDYIKVNYKGYLNKRYNINDDNDSLTILKDIALNRGYLNSGIPDMKKAALTLINEIRDNKVGEMSFERPSEFI